MHLGAGLGVLFVGAFDAILPRSRQVGRQRVSSLQLLQKLIWLWILLVKLRGRQAQAFQVLQLCFARGIIDSFRRQLLFDVLIDADRPYPFDIAGPRAETEPVQDVQNALIFRETAG